MVTLTGTIDKLNAYLKRANSLSHTGAAGALELSASRLDAVGFWQGSGDVSALAAELSLAGSADDGARQ